MKRVLAAAAATAVKARAAFLLTGLDLIKSQAQTAQFKQAGKGKAFRPRS